MRAWFSVMAAATVLSMWCAGGQAQAQVGQDALAGAVRELAAASGHGIDLAVRVDSVRMCGTGRTSARLTDLLTAAASCTFTVVVGDSATRARIQQMVRDSYSPEYDENLLTEKEGMATPPQALLKGEYCPELCESRFTSSLVRLGTKEVMHTSTQSWPKRPVVLVDIRQPVTNQDAGRLDSMDRTLQRALSESLAVRGWEVHAFSGQGDRHCLGEGWGPAGTGAPADMEGCDVVVRGQMPVRFSLAPSGDNDTAYGISLGGAYLIYRAEPSVKVLKRCGPERHLCTHASIAPGESILGDGIGPQRAARAAAAEAIVPVWGGLSVRMAELDCQ